MTHTNDFLATLVEGYEKRKYPRKLRKKKKRLGLPRLFHEFLG
jgi:hypothetical protein